MAEEKKPTEQKTEGKVILGATELKDKLNSYISTDKISLKNLTQIVYLCQALSFIFGISAIVGVVLNYLKLSEVKGSWLESHFTWQIRTFWLGLAFAIVGFILTFVFIGILILIANLVWIVYRVVKGWLLLNENKPIEKPAAFI